MNPGAHLVWEAVTTENGGRAIVDRAPIPGGWLYHCWNGHSDTHYAGSIAFVPAALAQPIPGLPQPPYGPATAAAEATSPEPPRPRPARAARPA